MLEYLGKTNNNLCLVAAFPTYLAHRRRAPDSFYKLASGLSLSRKFLVNKLEWHCVSLEKIQHSFLAIVRMGAATIAAAIGIQEFLINFYGDRNTQHM